ncbi:MAG: glycosyltransferase, partial [Actinomycetota bacterium]|nr:glycosyltransferase [Actinomycetota bacterium]
MAGQGTRVTSYALYTPVLRSSHLERLAPLPGFRVLATSRHPDCDPALLAQAPFPVLLGGLDVLEADLRADPPDVLEVTEPLWAAEWPVPLRLADAAPGALLAAYAIEVLPSPLPDQADRRVAVAVAVAYGSAAAERAHRTGPTPRWLSLVAEERRSRCPVCFGEGSPDVVPAEPELVFAAELSERTGVDLLVQAWDGAAPDGWRLRLLGWGPRTEQVRGWAGGRADVTLRVAADRQQVHDAMRRAAAVVLPSRRVPGWREQVGLSLVEGLTHGCRLLTTTETGIADGLGPEHLVVPAGSADALAEGLR